MGLLSTPIERAERRVSDIDAEIAAIESRRSPDLDFEQNFKLGEDIGLLRRKRAEAVKAHSYVLELQAKAAKDAERAKGVAEVSAYRREAEREAPGRLNKIDKLQNALAPELAWLREHIDKAGRINELAHRFGLPGVVDGETLFRGTPARVTPAVHEERTVWRDGAGRSPAVYRTLANGEEVPAVNGYIKHRERVQVRAEYVTPAELPGGRLAEGIRLMDVKSGRSQWPASR